MTQATPIIGADKSGLDYRTEDNDGKKALLNHHKGSSAPSYAEAGIIWMDDSATPWLLKCYDGADWITMGSVNASTNAFIPYRSGAALGDAAVATIGTSGNTVPKNNTANTFSDNQTIEQASANASLNVRRTTTSASSVQILAGATGGFIGTLDTTDFKIMTNGTVVQTLYSGGGVTVGSPTGGNKGAGTINATAVYDDNTLLTCYVLQTYLDGAPSDEIWEAFVPAGQEHFGYGKFKARLGTVYDPLDMDKYWQHVTDKGHLTSLPGRVHWNNEVAISTGELLQRLWETVEIQAVHIHQLHERLKILETA